MVSLEEVVVDVVVVVGGLGGCDMPRVVGGSASEFARTSRAVVC